jgi:hypothetical protein
MHAGPAAIAAAKDNGVEAAAAAYACSLSHTEVCADFTGLGLRKLPELSPDATARLQGLAASFNALSVVPMARMGRLRRLDLSANRIRIIPEGFADLVPRLEVRPCL